jgi:hypothetical protein
MADQPFGRDKIERNLHEAIEQLQDDLARIQLWASALGSFSQPIPDYRPGNDFVLPQAEPGTAYEPMNPQMSPQERLYR